MGLYTCRNGADIAVSHPGRMLCLGLFQQLRGLEQINGSSSHDPSGLKHGGMGHRCLALSYQLPGMSGSARSIAGGIHLGSGTNPAHIAHIGAAAAALAHLLYAWKMFPEAFRRKI